MSFTMNIHGNRTNKLISSKNLSFYTMAESAASRTAQGVHFRFDLTFGEGSLLSSGRITRSEFDEVVGHLSLSPRPVDCEDEDLGELPDPMAKMTLTFPTVNALDNLIRELEILRGAMLESKKVAV